RRDRLARRRGQDGPHREGRPDDRRPAAPGLTAPTMGLHDLSDLSYPWDAIDDLRTTAAAHPGGLVNLPMGPPVGPTPAGAPRAPGAASAAPGYPMTAGTPELRAAVAGWFARRRGVPDLGPAAVVPTIGSKELVGLLPSLLRLGP